MIKIELKNGAVVFKPHFEFTWVENNRHFSYCRICGDTYYNEDREKRRLWSHKHASKHSQKEHDSLKKRNLWMTPEAQYRLAGHGVVSITDLVLDGEVRAAGKEAPREAL